MLSDRALHQRSIGYVTHHKRYFSHRGVMSVLQAVEDHDWVTASGQLAHCVRTDVPGAAGYEDSHAWQCAIAGQALFFTARQPPARLLAMICLNIATRADALMVSPRRTATVRAVVFPWPAVMIPSGSGTM